MDTPEGDVLPPPGDGFIWSKNRQLLFHIEGTEGDDTYVLVSQYPVYLDTVQTAELDRSSFSYSFKSFLPKIGWQEIIVDAATLFGPSGIATMFGKGVVIHEPKYFQRFVRQQVDDYHAENDLETRYDQFGWKNDNTAFLYGEKLYTPVGPLTAIGAKEVHARSQWLRPTERGSLYAWTEAADNLFASNMEGISAAVLASFAAPLMRFQSQDEGGAIIHLTTDGSGRGKTTSLMGAWTAWGTKEGLNLTNEDTKVAKPITLGVLGNLPVIYDELGDKDPEVIRRLVVMFTEGRDRMRGNVDGTIRHTKANWQTIMISAANKSLIEQLETESTDAPAFRVLELPAQLPDDVDKAKGDRWRTVLANNAGHAGDAYLRYLLQPEVLAWTKAALEQWTTDLWSRTNLDSAHRFRIRLVGAIAVASALVNKLEILHFQTGRIVEYLIGQLVENHHRGSVSSVPSAERFINAFGEFINYHVGEVLVVADAWKPKTYAPPLLKPHNRLSIRYEVATKKVYISWAVFKDWATKRELSPSQMLKALIKHRVVHEAQRAITLSAGTDLPGVQVKALEADASHPCMSGMLQVIKEQVKSVASA